MSPKYSTGVGDGIESVGAPVSVVLHPSFPAEGYRLRSIASRLCPALAALILVFTPIARADEEPGSSQTRPHDHADMANTVSDPDSRAMALLMNLASGTSSDPGSAHAHMTHIRKSRWTLMVHGTAFITDIQQTGPRGEDQIASPNWFMMAGARGVGAGALMLRGMLSLDPATVRQRASPQLFQTGEEHDGVPIVDGQHPHDFFMELAVAYARPFGRKSSFLLYAAPVGDPALGPVAFPHRSSNAENPTAVLGHHLQDSTHIASDVITAGWDCGTFRIEGSGFHGAEPDNERWNIDQGPIDSWAMRASFRPTREWVAQLSRGKLTNPEAHEPGDITRSTASVLYQRDFPEGGLSAGAVWGRNDLEEGLTLESYLIETAWNFSERNYVFGRFERVDRNELFADDPRQEAAFSAAGIHFFTVNAATAGYTRDFPWLPGWQTGIGADATAYRIPSTLGPFYGSGPRAYHLFLRIRRIGSPDHPAMHEHQGHP